MLFHTNFLPCVITFGMQNQYLYYVFNMAKAKSSKGNIEKNSPTIRRYRYKISRWYDWLSSKSHKKKTFLLPKNINKGRKRSFILILLQ